MTKEVSQWAREQLLQARERKESQRRRLRAAVAFREEDLGVPLPIVTVTRSATNTATASNIVGLTGMTPAPFITFTSAAPLTPPTAAPVTNLSTDVSATHSQSHRRGAPTSWSTFLEDVQSSSTMSSLLSTQRLPTLMVKKPLHFRQPKKEQKTRAKRGPLWRYALDSEATAEDRRRAEEEELAQLGHNTPVTHHALCDFLTTSGPTSPHVTFPSTSGIMARKSPPSM